MNNNDPLFAKGYDNTIDNLTMNNNDPLFAKGYDNTVDNPKEVSKTNRAASEFDDTVAGMLSTDYRKRFKAEYRQTKIRYEKLHKMLVKAAAGNLEFKLSSPVDLLRKQETHMGEYLYCLEIRAQIEGIEI